MLAAQVRVGSAGTMAPVGAPIGAEALRIAESLGGDPHAHRARRLTDELIAEADLVLAASRAHRDLLLSRVPSAMRRTFTFRRGGRTAERIGPRRPPQSVADLRLTVAEFADGRVPPDGDGADDVIDPQGQPSAAYLRMSSEQVPALADLAATLFGMSPADRDAYRGAAGDAERLGIAEVPGGGRR